MTRIYFLFSCLTLLISCDRKLNEVQIKDASIEVNWYEISEITTAHDFVEIKRKSSKMKILEANSDGIADISIIGDTILIKALPNLILYTIKEKAFDYNIKLDTSITYEYYLKKVREREQEY